jgi:hypothetical protein
MNENAPILPMTLEERIAFLTDWYENFGAEKMIKLCAEYQVFMSARCKEYRATIKQLSERADTGEPNVFPIDDATDLPDEHTGFSLFGSL